MWVEGEGNVRVGKKEKKGTRSVQGLIEVV